MIPIPHDTYGLQLMVDGYSANKAQCGNVTLLYDFLMQLPSKIGMRRVGFPHIIKITEPGIKGLSGFVFIMESHISIHTYEERGFITADIYSCKSFDASVVRDYLIDTFEIKSFEHAITFRGRRFDTNEKIKKSTLLPVNWQ